ncbi:MAG: RHS repeat-associated core domain-containing protein, partial [Chloroflexi bacterium]|nr:RHS repeat-associated core domain-containing protein [Chloroflexota bacterium]
MLRLYAVPCTTAPQAFDVENRLTAVTATQGVSVSVTRFGYDADGARVVMERPGGGWTIYAGELLEEDWDGGGFVARRSYYYHGSRRVALRQSAGAVTFIHGDHLGSTSVTTGRHGGSAVRQWYEPYGAVRWSTGALPTDYGFTGQRHDESIRLIQMGARWYDARIGRWISPDTIVPERGVPHALNRYAYVRNSPCILIDESGHCWGIAGGIRGFASYGTTCNNLDMALTIAQHPEATTGQKAGAIAYVVAEGGAHLALAVGSGMLAWEGVSAVATAAASAKAAATVSTAATAACADGDCTNEAGALRSVGRGIWQSTRGLIYKSDPRCDSSGYTGPCVAAWCGPVVIAGCRPAIAARCGPLVAAGCRPA